MSPPRNKPPGSLSTLQRWVREYADSVDEPVLRLQRQVSFMVIAGALERAVDEQGRRSSQPRAVSQWNSGSE